MTLHLDNNGKIQIVTPPKTLTSQEKQILENTPVNEKLLQEASNTKFNVVYG